MLLALKLVPCCDGCELLELVDPSLTMVSHIPSTEAYSASPGNVSLILPSKTLLESKVLQSVEKSRRLPIVFLRRPQCRNRRFTWNANAWSRSANTSSARDR